MTPRAGRRLATVRGLAAAGAATLAATLGHSIAQHALPAGWILALAVVLAAPVCVALVGRRLSIPRLTAAVVLSQIGFHLLLRLDFGAPSMGAASGHHGGAPMSMTTTDAAVPALHDLSPSMWAGHAVAALATVLVLLTAERALRALAILARRPFRALAALDAPAPVRRAMRIARRAGIRVSCPPAGMVLRRGPPAIA